MFLPCERKYYAREQGDVKLEEGVTCQFCPPMRLLWFGFRHSCFWKLKTNVQLFYSSCIFCCFSLFSQPVPFLAALEVQSPHSSHLRRSNKANPKHTASQKQVYKNVLSSQSVKQKNKITRETKSFSVRKCASKVRYVYLYSTFSDRGNSKWFTSTLTHNKKTKERNTINTHNGITDL